MEMSELIEKARARMTPDYLATVKLRNGTGSGEEGDACLIQTERRILRDVAREAGDIDLAAQYDPKSDACTPCTSPSIHRLSISVQDSRKDWRKECVSILPLLVGSRGSDALERRRIYRIVDFSVREVLPICLKVIAANLKDGSKVARKAAELAALPPIIDARIGDMAIALLAEVRDLRALSALSDLSAIPSPVALLRELCEMTDADPSEGPEAPSAV